MNDPNAAPATGCVLPCPRCGEEGASITLSLADADGLTCQDCGEEFTVAEMRDLVGKWSRLIRWIDSMPSDPAE